MIVRPSADSENSINVRLYNATSASSGIYRVLADIKETGESRSELSAIEQNIYFRIINLDREKFKKKDEQTKSN